MSKANPSATPSAGTNPFTAPPASTPAPSVNPFAPNAPNTTVTAIANPFAATSTNMAPAPSSNPFTSQQPPQAVPFGSQPTTASSSSVQKPFGAVSAPTGAQQQGGANHIKNQMPEQRRREQVQTFQALAIRGCTWIWHYRPVRHAIESALLEGLELDAVPDYIGKHYPQLPKPDEKDVCDYVSFQAKWLTKISALAKTKKNQEKGAQEEEPAKPKIPMNFFTRQSPNL